MVSPDLALLVAAAGLAGALTVADAVPLSGLSRGVAARVWTRRTAARTLALGLLAIGVRQLADAVALVVWHDAQAFLLRRPGPLAPPSLWAFGLMNTAAGLVLVRWTCSAGAAAAMHTLIAFAAGYSWLATARLLPLTQGRAGWLLVLTLVVAAPAGLGAWRRWQRVPPADPRAEARFGTATRRCGLALALATPALLTDRWMLPWMAPAVVVPLAALAALTLIGAAHEGLRRELPAGGTGWRLLSVAWGDQRRVAWGLLTALGMLLHWSVWTSLVPMRAADDRRVMDTIVAWPQLLTQRHDPDEAAWAQVGRRLEVLIANYGQAPQTGQWLLLLSWIESTRLSHFHTATLLLREARDTYGSARAVAPPGWPVGRTVGEIAERTLKGWGRLVDPGSAPA